MILIDTTPLVALCDTRDSKHDLAVRHLHTLHRQDFVVCDAVLTEACFHLPHAIQRQRLRFLLRELGVRAPSAAGGSEFWLAVFDWLAKYGDHDPDWADACLAVLSGHDKALKVWTYDREFRTLWRRPNGTTIPMAVRTA
jgi:predicted nucleic acid-binding protein